MKIVLNGIETNNKGAELMLYAILQEIESRYPDATVYLPYWAYQKDLSYLMTPLKVKNIPFAKSRIAMIKLHIPGILRRLGINPSSITEEFLLNNVDYFLDGSGFAISDQWKPNKWTVAKWEYLCKEFGNGKSKMVFLPQAFGPVDKPATKEICGLMSKYADVIMPREAVSEKYLLDSGVDKSKLRKNMDFTALVEGVIPQKYNHLKNGVCVIPNARMIDKGIISKEDYISILKMIINLSSNSGHPTYILNHEGIEDEILAKECVQSLKDIEVVTGLNALEVKGLISTAYLCISSRFHGVASALNSCVPCLATSWSHKYAELFKDYGLFDCVLDLNDKDLLIKTVSTYLDPKFNQEIRGDLKAIKPAIIQRVKNMWRIVWDN